jgi:integrative and conjugative element protein (TIGR02256 family)
MMKAEATKYLLLETGGFLIGYKVGQDTVVTHATGPGPKAKHGYFSFERDIKYCNSQLKKLYKETKGSFTYIGEWHTHPFGWLSPSSQDQKQMKDIARTISYRNVEPLLIIGKTNWMDDCGFKFRNFLFNKRSYNEIQYKICNDVSLL